MVNSGQKVPTFKKKGCYSLFRFQFNPAQGLLSNNTLFRGKIIIPV